MRCRAIAMAFEEGRNLVRRLLLIDLTRDEYESQT